MNNPQKLSLLALALAVAFATQPAAASELADAISNGKTNLDLRLRYEQVDQDNALKDALALTLRARLGYQTAALSGWSAGIEFEANETVDGDYNSTTNGETTYSVIADPEYQEINQAYIVYQGFADTTLKYGRQRLVLDNHRFIGNVGWRQNEQTFDGLSVNNKSLANTTITFAYLSNANRIFGDDHPLGDYRMQSPIINIKYDGFALGALSGYGYFLNFDDNANLSTSTIGLRFAGQFKPSGEQAWHYAAEFARQQDYADNPASFDLDYLLLDFGWQHQSVQINLKHEVLSGNGAQAFQTPLATLHAFNGWSDQFLTTPANGLVDNQLVFSATIAGIKLIAELHDFSADRGGGDYGSEFGLLANKSWTKQFATGLKLAQYQADDFSGDTDKLWLWAEFKF